MARKNRCSRCGYTFRADDREICPSCLAPRDDVQSCDDIHPHGSIEDVSFTQNDVSFTRNDVSFTQPQTRNDSGNTFNRGSFSSNNANNQKKKNNSAAKKILIIYVIIVIIAAALISFSNINSRNEDNVYSYSSYEFVMSDISMPDISLPDISMPDFDFYSSNDNEMVFDGGGNVSKPEPDGEFISLGDYISTSDTEFAYIVPRINEADNTLTISMLLRNTADEETVISPTDYAPVLLSFDYDENAYIKHAYTTLSEDTHRTVIPGEMITFEHGYDISNAQSDDFYAEICLVNADGTVSVYYIEILF